MTVNAARTNVDFNDRSSIQQTESYYMGFQTGYNIERVFNASFSISTGIEYAFRRVRYYYAFLNEWPVDQLNYISLPVFSSYTIIPNLNYFIGFQADYLLNKDFNITDRNDGNGFISCDLSLITGLTYHLKPFGIGLKWRYGIIPYIQDSDTRSSEITDFEARSTGFELFTAYVFE